MRRAFLAVASSLIALCGCSGPSSNPGSTVESYYAAANDSDWAEMVKHLAPETIKRIGSESRMAKYLETQFEGWSDFEVEIEDVRIANDEKNGTVKFKCTGQVFFIRDRKLHPATCNDLWSVSKQDDGRWYIVLPESQRLKPMQ